MNAEYVTCLDGILKHMGQANSAINDIVKQALELSRSRNNYAGNDN